MSSVLAQRGQPTHQIALIKPVRGAEEPVEHALQLFDSMLWVFRGTTRAHWNLSSPSEADVIVVHHAEPAEHVAQWRAQGKVVVVLRTESTQQQLDDHTLIYPFPASQVMSLLERLDAELDTTLIPQPVPSAARAAPVPVQAWALIESIRTLRAARNPNLWLAVRDSTQPLLWLRGDAARYECSAGARQALRLGSLPLGAVSLEKSAPPHHGMISGRGEEVTWFAAYHSGATPAPWLSATLAYRLRRWPDFGVLRPADPGAVGAQMRLIAALDSAPGTVAELTTRTGSGCEEVIRVFNALSACDLLEPAVPTDAPRHNFTLERPKLGFRQLFDSIRRHLRFGSDT